MLELLGLVGYKTRYAFEMSCDMQRRVAFTQALRARRHSRSGERHAGEAGNPSGMPYHVVVMNRGQQTSAGICPGVTALVQHQRRALIAPGATGDNVAWRAR